MKYSKWIFWTFIFLCLTSGGDAQVTNLTVNGVGSDFTVGQGESIRWEYDIPTGATAEGELWLDLNNNGMIDELTDKQMFGSFTQTDGQYRGQGGPGDMDSTVNGHIVFTEANSGFAPAKHIFRFTHNKVGETIAGTVSALPSPTFTVSGTVVPPPLISPQNMIVLAQGGTGSGQWMALTDSSGKYTVGFNSSVSGQEVRFTIMDVFPLYVVRDTTLTMTVNYTGIDLVFSPNSRDMFTARQLTLDPIQEGFATWSPDGKYIVYQRTDLRDTTGKNGLWKILPDGSGATQVFDGIAEHPKWSPDGRYIVFDSDTGRGMKMIPAGGGDPIVFLPDTVRIASGGLPCWSPGASQIAFKDTGYWLCIYDLNTRRTTRIFRQEGMAVIPGCWSKDGKHVLIALMDRETRKSTIWKISFDGKEKKQITGHHENFYRYLALSPDGSLLVYAALEGRYLGLYIMPAEGGMSLPLAVTTRGHNEGASWSPDGKKVAFTSTRSGSFDIWMMDVNVEQVKRELRVVDQ